MTKVLSILGSTGSIGLQALQVARDENIKICAISAKSQINLIEEQIREFHPRLAVMYDDGAAEELKKRVSDVDIEILSGDSGLLKVATCSEADTVLVSVVGSIGLKPTLEAIKQGKKIALANKETLVCAGEIVMQKAKEYGASIIPVDSEHSAVFQCLQGCKEQNEIRRLILTCSGGPFYGKTYDDLENMRACDALKHPNWSMGSKITIDSATLMNKGLEIIEAMRLYSLPLSKVDAIIHRQSIVHSFVEYRDGALLAQLGVPDMKLPIRYAFTYPYRSEVKEKPLDLLTCGALTFDTPDEDAFRCLKLAKQCAELGGTSCSILNAANEEAVLCFLRNEIGFNDIHRKVEDALNHIEIHYNPDLETILNDDNKARLYVNRKG